MAKFHYDLTGAEPIIRDVPVHDTTTLVQGEFVSKSITTAEYPQVETGYVGGAGEMSKGLGIMNETISTISTADFGDHISTAATTTAKAISTIANVPLVGNRYGKVIINPFAVYLTERDQSSNAYITAVACSASTTYTDTMEDEFDGGFIYVCSLPTTSVAANRGQLRYIAASTSTTSVTLLTAMTTTTAEKIIKILPWGHDLIGLSADGLMTSDLTAHTAPTEIYLQNLESYVGGPNKPLEPLRQQVHDGITDTTLKFYNDILIKDHFLNGIVV